MKKTILATLVAAGALLSACNSDSPAHRSGNLTKGYPKARLETSTDTLSYLLGMANSPSEPELMRYLSDPRTGSDSTYAAEFMRGMREGMQAADNKKRSAYLAGLQTGMQMGSRIKQMEDYIFAGDSTQSISTRNYLAGFAHGLDGKKTALKIDGKLIDRRVAGEEANKRVEIIAAENIARRYEKEKKASEDFIAAKAKEEGMKQLAGGTLYKEIVHGDGPLLKDDQRAKVSYEGRFADGTVFDASDKHPGVGDGCVTMKLGMSVPGFDAALRAMPIGSEWEIYIPWNQAYGAQGMGMIPPFSALIFKVKIVGLAD